MAVIRGIWAKGEASEICNITGFENKGRGANAKEWGQYLEVGKGKETDAPLEFL